MLHLCRFQSAELTIIIVTELRQRRAASRDVMAVYTKSLALWLFTFLSNKGVSGDDRRNKSGQIALEVKTELVSFKQDKIKQYSLK